MGELVPGLGPAAVDDNRGEIAVDVKVVADAGGWSASLVLEGPEGDQTRHISAPACSEIADATALILAVSLEPVAVAKKIRLGEGEGEGEGETEEETEPGPEVEVEPGPESTADTEAHRAPPEVAPAAVSPDPRVDAPQPNSQTESPRFRSRAADARARGDVGIRPRVALGVWSGGGYGPTSAGYGAVGGHLAVFAPGWRWQLAGQWWIPRTLRLDDDRGARIQGWWLGMRGCWSPSAGPVELPICAGMEAGEAIGTGVDPTSNPRDGRIPWVAVVPALALRWPFLRRLALSLDLELPVNLMRAQFRIDGEPFQPLVPVAFRASAGFELQF